MYKVAILVDAKLCNSRVSDNVITFSSCQKKEQFVRNFIIFMIPRLMNCLHGNYIEIVENIWINVYIYVINQAYFPL